MVYSCQNRRSRFLQIFHFLFLCVFLFQAVVFADSLERITFNYGVNNVDLNGDEVMDYVVKTRFPAVSAHGFDRYVLVIRDEVAESGVIDTEIPVWSGLDGRYIDLVTHEGADCFLRDFAFYRAENGTVFFKQFERDIGENYATPMPVRVTEFEFKPWQELGDLPFEYREKTSEVTVRTYCDVRDVVGE